MGTRSARSGRRTLIVLLVLASSASAWAQYPQIARLDRTDPLYLQHQQDVQLFYRRLSADDELPPLLIYRYTARETDTIFGLAARFSLPYSAIATLNRLPSPEIGAGQTVLVPGVPGVFVPLAPRTDLELVMHDLREAREASVVTARLDEGITVFRFFPAEDFLPEERTAFLGLLFRHPLPNGELSSPFGPRANPITAEWSFHGGADYAAPAGTDVLAARGGRVAEIGYNDILGNYIILEHSGHFETLYGHLAAVAVSLNDEVRSGIILGAVGDTGLVTGPHLHFEIRQNGRSRDPEPMLP